MKLASATARWFMALLWVAAPASADLLSLDLESPGDGFVTLDTTTALEWLDVPLTLGLPPAEVLGGAGGWTASGWRYATIGEACDLFARHVAPVPDCPDPEIQISPIPEQVAEFIDLFGATFVFEGAVYTAGFVAGSEPDRFGDALVGNAAASFLIDGFTDEFYAVSDNIFFEDNSLPDFGSFLVRPIPEPATLPLVGLGLLGLAMRTRRNPPVHLGQAGSPRSDSEPVRSS